jgi:polyphosphate kinase
VGATRRFLGSLGRDKPHRVLAVCTAAVRDASNGHRLFDELSRVAEVAIDLPHLKDRPPAPLPVPAFETAPDIWAAIRAGDVLVHHPYHSFDAVTRFVQHAAEDPRACSPSR